MLLLLLGACGPDEGAFYQRTFTCNAALANPHCGTTADGAGMICLANRQLGADNDVCVEKCGDKRDFSDDADSICTDNHALLHTCRPSEKTPGDPDGCGPDLACYRTDLVHDQGVCMAVKVCDTDDDCGADLIHLTCAGPLIQRLFPTAHFQISNLNCVQSGCHATKTKCPASEACMRDVLPPGTTVPDICVPKCVRGACPPNYYCRDVIQPAGGGTGGGTDGGSDGGQDGGQTEAKPTIHENLCLPGMLGARCQDTIGCAAGECVATTGGFGQCAVPCQTDDECLALSAMNERSYCVPPSPDSPTRYCISPNPFEGAACLPSLPDEQCPQAGQHCYAYSPYSPKPNDLGDCRFPCGPNDECPVRGGLAHTCFVHGNDRSCYPGRLGLPCHDTSNCLPEMSCQDVRPEPRLGPGAPSARICTQSCDTDADCDRQFGPSHDGYCDNGWCRLGGGQDEPCDRDAECRSPSGRCVGLTPDILGSCLIGIPEGT